MEELRQHLATALRKHPHYKSSMIIKVIELVIACICLATYSEGAYAEESPGKIGLAFCTFGAYILIPLALLIGYAIDEVTPRLQILYNSVGGILFVTSGGVIIESWWQFQVIYDTMSVEAMVSEDQLHYSNMMLVSGLLSLFNGAFYLADIVLGIVLCHMR